MTQDLATLTINTLRTLSIDGVQKANSGHPGLPMGCAPMAYTLYQRHLTIDPTVPLWPDRDRFVLSAGHGSMLLYSLLHLYGFDLPMAEIEKFRQWDSRTPGHPEWHWTVGVEATTGPLGQGTANAVGMAIAERYLAHTFNRPGHTIVDHHTYALVSDGDMMEGLSNEAGSLAGHLGLGKLIYLYDANEITLDGPLSLSMSEDVGKRYEALGWHVQHIQDGDHDVDGIDRAIAAAKAETRKPSIIVIKTTIGFGSPKKAGSNSSHGSPLGVDEVAATKTALGWDPTKHFYVPDEARAHAAEVGTRGAAARADWDKRFAAYRAAHPDLAQQWDDAFSGKVPAAALEGLPSWELGSAPVATRDSSSKVLTALCAKIPWLFGGDADLGHSTKTLVPGGNFDVGAGTGRNLRFGIRENAMGSLANGMVYHGGIRPFTATFFCFSDYMRPAVRLAALNHLPAIFVWTHDSIGLGEDGPTHQPVEQLMSLRAMPNINVWRPCDGNETVAAWKSAMTSDHTPSAMIMSRQNLPNVTAVGAPGAERGAYVLREQGGVAKAIIIGTGSEIMFALQAQDKLTAAGIATRVVSMPCWDVFANQDQAYRDSVLPPALTARVSIEAGAKFGWKEWVGDRGIVIGLDRFGASAPAETIYEKLGITADAVVAAVKKLAG